MVCALVRGSTRDNRRRWRGPKPLIFMRFHGVFLGSQHEIWSKQYNGKVRDLLQFEANCRDGIPARPEVFAREVSLPSIKLTGNGDRAFAFQKPDHGGHSMLWGDLDADMHMIRHQVAFQDAAFLLPRQFMEDRPQSFPNGAVQGLPTPLGHKHYVILAIPPGMRQALIGVRHRVLLRCALIKPPEENSTPGSLKALLVSLVKPVAYLKY